MNEEEQNTLELTRTHIRQVGRYMSDVSGVLIDRAFDHDNSKFDPKEFDTFVRMTARLKGLTYGSQEYKDTLAEMNPALAHHYKHNRHHPEHYVGGVKSMSLLDMIEMLCDWKAATERHDDGCLVKSMEHNLSRFNIPTLLWNALVRTAFEMEWITDDDTFRLIEFEQDRNRKKKV
jgi:hypothetical protein